jgi:DNA primase
MPGIDFSKLRGDITMRHVLELVRFECVRRQAEQWYGYCPLHESITKHRRSFSVNVTKGCYYCHACHSHGDQFKLWAEVSGLPVRQATIDLCNRLGHKIPWMHRW